MAAARTRRRSCRGVNLGKSRSAAIFVVAFRAVSASCRRPDRARTTGPGVRSGRSSGPPGKMRAEERPDRTLDVTRLSSFSARRKHRTAQVNSRLGSRNVRCSRLELPEGNDVVAWQGAVQAPRGPHWATPLAPCNFPACREIAQARFIQRPIRRFFAPHFSGRGGRTFGSDAVHYTLHISSAPPKSSQAPSSDPVATGRLRRAGQACWLRMRECR
jgi:hypothetical protein